MSYQLFHVSFIMWTTLSIWFKTEKSCKGDVNHNITKGASDYSGLPYMMSRDQLYHVMTSSDSHRDTVILSRAYAIKRCTIISPFLINRLSSIKLVSELFDPPTYIYIYIYVCYFTVNFNIFQSYWWTYSLWILFLLTTVPYIANVMYTFPTVYLDGSGELRWQVPKQSCKFLG